MNARDGVLGKLPITEDDADNRLRCLIASSQPSPFVAVSPEDGNQLYALQSIRGFRGTTQGRIVLWTATADDCHWRANADLIHVQSGHDELLDWSYPWMTPMQGNRWLLVLYARVSDGGSSLYGMIFNPDT